jgi:CubicO group peptidase (beta-lactamase class C family)
MTIHYLKLLHTASFILLLSLCGISCSLFRSKEPAKLPVLDNPNLLDSSQAQIVFNHVQHFPNGTQLSICIITGDSERYVGIERRNDSLVYIDNSDSVFEIGSMKKTFTGTILAKLVYDGKELYRGSMPRIIRSASL